MDIKDVAVRSQESVADSNHVGSGKIAAATEESDAAVGTGQNKHGSVESGVAI